jgi:SAM-dependent methyltransferase
MIEKIKKIIIFNRFISYHVFKTDEFVKKIAGQIENDSKILDVGAGLCPYKKYFNKAVYISQDLCVNGDNTNWNFSHIDIKSDASDMPIEENTFDYILCTSVLEHLSHSGKAFREFSRVLRKKGRLFLIVPLTVGEHHEPFDYFRFTQFGLKLLAQENGFDVIEIKRQGGFFIFLSQTLTGLSYYYVGNKYLEKSLYILFYPINFAIAFVCYFLDRIDKTSIVMNYECIFEKK